MTNYVLMVVREFEKIDEILDTQDKYIYCTQVFRRPHDPITWLLLYTEYDIRSTKSTLLIRT